MGRVLVVRPAPALVAMLGTVLDLTRHELEFCGGSAETIRRVRERAVDVVVTDAATSVEEDLALAAELQQVRPSLKVIVLAAEATQADVVEAIRAHVFACFTSPFDCGEIAAMAGNALLAETWRDGIEVISGLPHWLTLRASCHLLTADRLVRFMTELQASVPDGDRDDVGLDDTVHRSATDTARVLIELPAVFVPGPIKVREMLRRPAFRPDRPSTADRHGWP